MVRGVGQPGAGRRRRGCPHAAGRDAHHRGHRGDRPQRRRVPARAALARARAAARPGGRGVRPRGLGRPGQPSAVDRGRALRTCRRARRRAAAGAHAGRRRDAGGAPCAVVPGGARVLRVHRGHLAGPGGRGRHGLRAAAPVGGLRLRGPCRVGRLAAHRSRRPRDVVACRGGARRGRRGAGRLTGAGRPGTPVGPHRGAAAAPRGARADGRGAARGRAPSRRVPRRGPRRARARGAPCGHRRPARGDQGVHPRDAGPQRPAGAHDRRPVRGRHGPAAGRRRQPARAGVAAARRPRARVPGPVGRHGPRPRGPGDGDRRRARHQRDALAARRGADHGEPVPAPRADARGDRGVQRADVRRAGHLRRQRLGPARDRRDRRDARHAAAGPLQPLGRAARRGARPGAVAGLAA